MREYDGKSVTIMSCRTCNTNCGHCYLGYEGDITSTELKDTVVKLSRHYDVDINGSEVLLNEGYFDSIKYVGQNRVLTNGIILNSNPTLIDKIKRYGIEWVCMSYHFDLHSKVSSVDFDLLKRNIELLKLKRLKIELMTTISTINYTEVLSMVNEAIKLGADCIRFTNFLKLGNAVNMNNDNLLSDEQIAIFFDQFYEAKDKYANQITARRSGTFGRDMRKENSTYYCPAGRDKVAITPDKKVYPCPFLVSKGYEIGEYYDGKILINKEFKNDGTTCLTNDIVNKNKILELKI